MAIKTLKGWNEYADTHEKSDWHYYCKPGDEIDREVYDYFLDILPPRTLLAAYFQVGEPYDHRQDEDGTWKGTYPTFCRREDSNGVMRYYYIGHCFPCKDKHIE